MSSAADFYVGIIWQDECIGQDKYSKKWFFSDESEQLNGPYDTEHEARISLVLYCWICLDTRTFAAFPDFGHKLNAELDKL